VEAGGFFPPRHFGASSSFCQEVTLTTSTGFSFPCSRRFYRLALFNDTSEVNLCKTKDS
jgi:hypothetical protein